MSTAQPEQHAARNARRARRMAALFGMLLGFAPLGLAQELAYELRFGAPGSHLIEVQIRAGELQSPAAEFAMPAWAPGSYVIQDYAANVQGFRAEDEQGRALVWRKTDKQTWRVELAGASSVRVRYRVYANTLANTAAQYNSRHAFLAGPAIWMYLVGGKERPIRLTIVDAPRNWRVATGMRRAAGNIYTAPDYDTFADMPLEISAWQGQTFDVAGTRYYLAVHDIQRQQDFSRAAADIKKIVEATLELFPAESSERHAPFEEFWFLWHIWPESRGGLEHLNSTQINSSRDWSDMTPAGRYASEYQLKLAVAAHEFYHAWNVKRLRPKALGPFDYSREVHTESLWLSEGITSYYGDLILLRAGLMSADEYLNNISQLITEYEQHPGRKERSLAEASWDTWFRDDRIPADTNLANTKFSYYDGGQIVGHLLDFAIREATGNQKSLDDWMRLLYSRYALPKPGFEAADLERAASEVAGRDVSEIFRKYVYGKQAIPYETYFRVAGLEVQRTTAPQAGWLGASGVADEHGRIRLTSIAPGGAAERAGLEKGDEIVGVDGRQIKAEVFAQLANNSPAGAKFTLTVARHGRLETIPVTLDSYPYAFYRLRPREAMDETQRKVYASWIGRK